MAGKNEISFDHLMQDLRNKIYYPVYLLHGEESYFIDEISGFIEENVLDEQEKEFNQTIVYGKDSNVSNLIGYAKRFPMMANYQVIIIKEAQDLDKLDDFQPYVENPLKSTLLVFCYKYGKLDKRKGLYKSIEKSGIAFESARFYDHKIPDWIHEYLGRHNCTISQKAAFLLTEFWGNDLSKVANELDKLLINATAGSEITEEYVEKNIGISKDFNVFELQKAIGKKEVFKANQIVRYFAANPRENPLVKVIPILYSFFSKILLFHYLPDKSRNSVASSLSVNPFFIPDYQIAAKNYPLRKLITIIGILREYDLKAKGVESTALPDGELMKELIFKILH
jgi:DNA polymerase III subunit delta